MTQQQAEIRAISWLGKANMRPTRQRISLAQLLVGDGLNRHVTAEGLHEAAGGDVSLATVYNTLKSFCTAGLLREVIVDGSRSYFDTNTSDHPHFYWEDTAQLHDAAPSQLTIANLPATPPGAELVSVDVVIRLRKARDQMPGK